MAGCSGSQNTARPEPAIVPAVNCTTPGCLDRPLAPGESAVVELNNGARIVLRGIDGRNYATMEGTFSETAFAEISVSHAAQNLSAADRQRAMGAELEAVKKSLVDGVKAILINESVEVGYLQFLIPIQGDLMGALKNHALPRQVVVNPVEYDPEILKRIKAHKPESEGLAPRSVSDADLGSFSGLAQIKVPEFLLAAESAIGNGSVVDGSSIRMGITDTGITYNHPTFRSNVDQRNRIVYMKDFTPEGAAFINPASTFAARAISADEVAIDAQVIRTPALPQSAQADAFVQVNALRVKVPPALIPRLTAVGTDVRLGLILESNFNTLEEPVDLNMNGRKDDEFVVLLLPAEGANAEQVYVDLAGTRDLRNVRPLRDFNSSQDVVPLFAEKVGVHIGATTLVPVAGGDPVTVRQVSIVGFDPGNHGTHVGGIAGGRQTFSDAPANSPARGVASNTNILMNRVCANNGGCSASQAIIDMAIEGKADVINMSLGGLSPFNDGFGVQETIVNRLTQLRNVLFMISAGNSGPGRQTIGSPSTARLSLSIGASASREMIRRQYQWPAGGALLPGSNDDFMLFFSSRGPTAAGGFKPNISAPGTQMSAVQLNAVPGFRSGLDVYWGTSMAAPTATGGYTLLLDAIRKFNAVQSPKIPTDVRVLRQVLIETARPADQRRLDVETGMSTSGQYTWMDQGTGIMDLERAWARVMALRSVNITPDLQLPDGTRVEPDYQVVTSMVAPNGITYDGTRSVGDIPAFGQGLYIDVNGTESLREVHIARRIPEQLLQRPDVGDLHRQLSTTSDRFRLKTVIYGSDKVWLKAGVQSEASCENSPTRDLIVTGRGVELARQPNGTTTLNGFRASTLFVCLDRQAIANDLPPGDHGALIYAYRIEDSGDVNPVASFVVPVSLVVPHKTLAGGTQYQIESEVHSFGISRNYVAVPAGTTLVRVEIEIPAVKVDLAGRRLAGEECSGVELMGLDGLNISKLFKTRAEARVSNCLEDGAPILDPARRKLVVTRTAPRALVWDLHVFGNYRFRKSAFKMTVDYLNAEASVDVIAGDLTALRGRIGFRVLQSSFAVLPDATTSRLSLDALLATIPGQVANGQGTLVRGPLGVLHSYPAEVKKVNVSTGGSPGNDIDLIVYECPTGTTDPLSVQCGPVGQSGGPADNESVDFVPALGKLYVLRVDGYSVRDAGNFTAKEKLIFAEELGSLQIQAASAGQFDVAYTFTDPQIQSSAILQSQLFRTSRLTAVGALSLRLSDGGVVAAVPVQIALP